MAMQFAPHGARLPRDFSKEDLREMYRIGKNRTVGNIFFVDCWNGNDAWDGLSPSSPKCTIAAALALCTSGQDDYIICMSVYQQDIFPISITKDCVHILGVAGPDGTWQMMDPPTDTAIFSLASGAENCEIAYFSLGGAAQGTHAAIELQGGNNQTWIHHCTFGHYWTSGGQDGIRFVTSTTWNVVIEDCWFYGDHSGSGHGKLARYGIVTLLGGHGACTVRNNYFLGCVGAIALLAPAAAHDWIIVHNYFLCGSDAAGVAIDLGAPALGCTVMDNMANYGDTEMAQNPYRDQAAAAANHWAGNMRGITLIMPA